MDPDLIRCQQVQHSEQLVLDPGAGLDLVFDLDPPPDYCRCLVL